MTLLRFPVRAAAFILRTCSGCGAPPRAGELGPHRSQVRANNKAIRNSDANFLAPFFYVSLIYSSAIGYLVFGETIPLTTMIGAAAILVSAAAMMFAARQVAPVPVPTLLYASEEEASA